MDDLTHKVETISRFCLCVLLGVTCGFGLLTSILMAHDWLAPYLCAIFGSVISAFVGLAAALKPAKLRLILLALVSFGMLALDAQLVAATAQQGWSDPLEAFRSVPLIAALWLILWLGSQAFALKLLLRHRPARRSIATSIT